MSLAPFQQEILDKCQDPNGCQKMIDVCLYNGCQFLKGPEHMTNQEIINRFARHTIFPWRGDWLFIDEWFQLWRIVSNHNPSNPFTIVLVHKGHHPDLQQT